MNGISMLSIALTAQDEAGKTRLGLAQSKFRYFCVVPAPKAGRMCAVALHRRIPTSVNPFLLLLLPTHRSNVQQQTHHHKWELRSRASCLMA